MDYVKRFFEFLFPSPAYQVPAVFFAVAIVVLVLVAVFSKKAKAKGYRANLALGVVISTLLEMVMLVNPSHRWQWIVGLLPTLLVSYQAFFLWLYHPRDLGTGTGDGNKGAELSGGTGSGGQATQQQDRLREVGYKRAIESMDSHFGLTTLFIRYGLPAVLLGITGIIMLDILGEPAKFFSLIRVIDDQIVVDENVGKILLGLRMGAAGAYVYVLLELGRRTFRHDVTGASAMWCLVTLVLGPVLAATVAILWRMGAPQTGDGWWGSGVVLFYAGFAPRRVIAAVEQAALQLLKVGSQNIVVESRLIPLGRIRGISPQIEERLSEEGIIDVNSLAAAEPVRLVRNTSFDMKQILSWIDEAILIATLPKSWESFEDVGITGAIDLCWYYDQLFDAEGELLKDIPEQIKSLATDGKIAPANLASTIQRLYEDAQVQYIWALYYNFTEYAGNDGSEGGGQQGTLSSTSGEPG